MFLITILLIIIAIGVLLASEAGQVFLDSLIKLAIIGGLLFLGFWIIIVAIYFFENDIGKSFAWYWYFWVSIILIAVLYYGRNYKGINKNIKNTNFESIFLNLLKAILLGDFGKIKSGFYNTWKYRKGWIIFIAFIALNIYLRYFTY